MKPSMSSYYKKQKNIKIISGGVTAPKGFLAGGVACGLKGKGKLDLAMILSESDSNKAFAAFTNSKAAAAPVLYDKDILNKNKNIRMILVNSGCANASTGDQGKNDAKTMAGLASEIYDIPLDQIVIASTGIIGKYLDLKKIENGLKSLLDTINQEGGGEAAQAIMTTDSFNKEIAVEVKFSSGSGMIGGMAKGAGMIAPKLVPQATMLVFITTDLELPEDTKIFNLAVDNSFNKITVDGYSSTNDSVFLIANGKSGTKISSNSDFALLRDAFEFICQELAKMIVIDGEGATKLIHYFVKGAVNEKEAEIVARNVANSILVKTAFFGEDPNWGRIVAVAGDCDVIFNQKKIDIWYGPVKMVENGCQAEHDKNMLREVMSGREIDVTIDLNLKDGKADFYGCDLTYDYIKLNAEYKT